MAPPQFLLAALSLLAVAALGVAVWMLCAYRRLLRTLGGSCPRARAVGRRAPGWPLRAYSVNFQAHSQGALLVCVSPDARALERDVAAGRVDAVVMAGGALSVSPGYLPGSPPGACVLQVAPLAPGAVVMGARLFGPSSLQDLLGGVTQGRALLIGCRISAR